MSLKRKENTDWHNFSSKKPTGDDASSVVRMSMNRSFYESKLRNAISHSYRNGQSLVDDSTGATLFDKPFQCCCLPNFITEAESIDVLCNQLRKLEFFTKSNDLYSFKQTSDLKTSSLSYVQSFRNLLFHDVLPWLRDITDIPLDNTLDITCSKYEYGDVLLCHDDELERRRIAFIYYLVPEWSSEDGGTLDLFTVDEHGDPDVVIKSLLPKRNTFIFFEVSPVSFHQVSEVITKAKKRLSINGWFHGPPLDRPKLRRLPSPRILESPNKIPLKDWINPTYLKIETQMQIRRQFEKHSEIQLPNFLNTDKFNAVCSQLCNNSNLVWYTDGPATKCRMDLLEFSSFPPIARDCFDLLNSERFYVFLASLTGLAIGGCKPLFSVETDDSEYSDNEELMGDVVTVSDVSDGEVHSLNTNETENYEILAKEDIENTLSGINSHSLNDQSVQQDYSQIVDPTASRTDRSASFRRCCRGSFRRWKHKYYTLIRDSDPENTELGLDMLTFFCSSAWKTECGGATVYLAKDEDEELLTIRPADNTLSLVYCDAETIKFVKYINHRFQAIVDDQNSSFFDLAMTYYE